MDMLLVKIFATALTLSQVTTAPDALKTEFDRAADQGKVVALLRDGCTHMRKALEIEDINLDDLLATAMEGPDLTAGGSAAFRGIKFADLQNAYHQFCTNETVPDWGFDAGAVIDFYNKTLADLPDPARLKGLQLPGAIVMLDRKGGRFREVFDADQRRISVPLGDIPVYVQKAFVAAEDKRFYEHAGIDERGLIRAAVSDMGKSGHPQGASTITQQVVKNLLVGDDVSYERKMREIVLTARVERALSKDEILELYLNTIYLGRSAWGVEMAARSYFGKPAKDLTLAEGAMLAGLPKGPSYFSPDRYPDRMRERRAYVLSRMQEDGVITAEEAAAARAAPPTLVPFEKPQRDFGFVFADQATREARTLAATHGVTSKSYTIRTTIDVPLQRSVEAALQEGLSRYERDAGRVHFQGPEANLDAAIAHLEGAPKTGVEKAADSDADPKSAADKHPAWQRALAKVRLPLYDVHWTPAVVLQTRAGKRARDGIEVGLADGRILPLSGDAGALQRNIKLHDVIFVRVSETKSRAGARAELRVRPEVQGTAVVLENKTGRILAMTGGFSYPLSQLNRATQAQRQPGSAIKPLSYLAALENGLQPNTLIRDEPITFPPIGGGRGEEFLVAEELRGRRQRHPDAAQGAGEFAQSRHRASARRRHRGQARAKSRSPVRAGAGDEHLSGLRQILSVRARRPAGAADRSRGVLCGHRQRRRAPGPACGRGDRGGRSDLWAGGDGGREPERRRPRRLLSAQDHDAGRLAQRHGARAGAARPLCGGQDRHHRGRERRLVRRIHQRDHGRGLGRLRQCGRGAPHARRRRDRRRRGGADFRIDRRGGLEQRHEQDRAGAAVGAGQDRAVMQPGRPGQRQIAPAGSSSDDCLRLDPKGHPMDARYRLVSRDSAAPRRNPDDDGSAPWGQWREPGGYGDFGSTGRPAGWARDGFFGGWRRDDQSGWQGQRRAFWNW